MKKNILAASVILSLASVSWAQQPSPPDQSAPSPLPVQSPPPPQEPPTATTRLSAADSAPEESDPWRTSRDWLTLALAIFAAGLSVYNLIEGKRAARRDRELEAKRLLDQAWDLMGGRPGTSVIVNFVKDKAQRELARRMIDQALHMAPRLPAAHRRRGALFRAEGKLEVAIESYKKALDLDDSAKGHNSLGLALRDQGKLDEAIEAYRGAIRLDSGIAIIHHNLGAALRKQGKLDEAIEAYRKAIRLDKDDARLRHSLGYALSKQGNLNEAIEAYRTAVHLDPDFELAHSDLKLALEKQDQATD